MSLTKPCAKCGVPGTEKGLCAKHLNKRVNPAYHDPEYIRNRRKVVELTVKLGLVCWKCGWPFLSRSDITVDHKVPLREGGGHNIENLAPAHEKCNKGWQRKKPPKPGVQPDLNVTQNDYLEW